MAEYCSATDVSNRLKSAGYINVADDDADGTVEAPEIAANVTPSIAWAGKKIDYYVSNRTPPYATAALRASGNEWCRDRCVDLAAWYIVTNGGRDAPDSFQSAYDEAIEDLKGIMDDGNVIPDTTIDRISDKNQNFTYEFRSEWTT